VLVSDRELIDRTLLKQNGIYHAQMHRGQLVPQRGTVRQSVCSRDHLDELAAAMGYYSKTSCSTLLISRKWQPWSY